MGPDRRATVGSTRTSLPCWVDYDAAFYGIPAVDGRGMKARARIATARSSTRRTASGSSTRNRSGSPADTCAQRFPTWPRRRSSRRASASTRPRPTRHFVIDRHPDFDNVWLVGGGSGHGFKHGPVIGATSSGGSTGRAGRARARSGSASDHERVAKPEHADRRGRHDRGLVGLVTRSPARRPTEACGVAGDRTRATLREDRGLIGRRHDPVDQRPVDDDGPDIASDDRAGHVVGDRGVRQRDHRLALAGRWPSGRSRRAVWRPAEDQVRTDRDLAAGSVWSATRCFSEPRGPVATTASRSLRSIDMRVDGDAMAVVEALELRRGGRGTAPGRSGSRSGGRRTWSPWPVIVQSAAKPRKSTGCMVPAP